MINELPAKYKDDLVVLGGDLNDVPDSNTLAQFLTQWKTATGEARYRRIQSRTPTDKSTIVLFTRRVVGDPTEERSLTRQLRPITGL